MVDSWLRSRVLAVDRSSLVPALRNVAARLRIDSIRATSTAGSGHPTSCCSAADVVAALFFSEMRFDPENPQYPHSDRFVLSTKAPTVPGDGSGVNWSATSIEQAIDTSLRNLRTDYLDVVHLHGASLDTLLDGDAVGSIQKAQKSA